MSLIPLFVKYAGAFEEAYESDDWSAIAPYFAPDAVYEIQNMPAPIGGRCEGRDAILAYFKSVLDGFDRKFASRSVALLRGPREEGRSVWIRGSATYTAGGAPTLRFELEETVTFDAQGRISRLEDRYDEEAIGTVTDYVNAHGTALELATST